MKRYIRGLVFTHFSMIIPFPILARFFAKSATVRRVDQTMGLFTYYLKIIYFGELNLCLDIFGNTLA